MPTHRTPNAKLRSWLDRAGWTGDQLARAINDLGGEAGIALRYQRASVAQWLAGMRPRPPVPHLIAEAFSRHLGRPVTVTDLGLESTLAGMPPSAPCWTLEAAATLLDVTLPAAQPPAADGRRAYSVAALAVPYWAEVSSLSLRDRTALSAPPSVSRADVQDAGTMLRLFSDADLMFGGGRVRQALTAYLRSTIAPWLGADSRPAVRRELLATAAQLSYLCGFVFFDDELHGTAQRYYLTSLRLAAEAGDSVGYVLALRALSVQAGQLGHHSEAVDLAEMAVWTAPKQIPPNVRAFLLGQLSVARAARGDRRTALMALTAAERQLAQAEKYESSVGVYHSASLAHQQAATTASFGDKITAIRLLETSLRRRPTNERRSRLITLATLAEHQAAIGRMEQSWQTWHLFLDDYPLVNCRRANTALRTMRARIRPHHGNPAARSLIVRAAELTSRTGAS
ncbi:hypothetical protein ACIA8G_09315 [Lentzea sp. NPDC051213]|uniref:hypothetical protein n=1 Tax=Lentzea sp. NPDC051213 TaxID=3364126 RepID=UPI0037893419